jgi:hypothetical protein
MVLKVDEEGDGFQGFNGSSIAKSKNTQNKSGG